MKFEILIFFIILTSCTNSVNEVVMEKWDNENPRIIHLYKSPNDSSEFIRQAYYRNGNLFSEGMIKNGSQNGIWKWWYENGVLKDEANLKNGEYFGSRKHWYPNGKPKHFESIFGTTTPNDNCPNGANLFFYRNGLLEQSDTIVNGLPHGHCIYYDSMTRNETHIFYNNGIKNGLCFITTPKGDTVKRMLFLNDELIE